MAGNATEGRDDALVPLLRPRSIAVVGASARSGSFGERLLASLTEERFAGPVYPINPRYETLADRRCYPSISALPEAPDCVAFAVSDELVEASLAEAAAIGARAAALFGRGYEANPGDCPPLPARLGAIARAAGMAVCGNNCMGFVNFVDGIKMSGNPPGVAKAPGPVALISHSGSTWSGLLGNQRQLGFNYAISAGQEIATTAADYLRFCVAQPETRAVGCIIETVRDPEGFLAALDEADRRGIPVVVLKLGRSEAGRRMALAHSGALTGSDAAHRAVFERRNVATVRTVDELTDTLELMAAPRRPTAYGIGIVTDSGGERELIVDLAADLGVSLAAVTPATEARLAATLDPGMATVNPVDCYGDGRVLLEPSLDILAEDPHVGIVALATNLVHGRAYLQQSGSAIEGAHGRTSKPALVFGNLHSTISREEAARLRALGIPVLMGTATALVAMRNLLDWQRRRDAGKPLPAAAPPAAVARARAAVAAAEGRPLAPEQAFAVLEAFCVPAAPCAFADNAAAAIAAADRLGYPVALKTAAADILHKTEAGGVALRLADAAAVRAAYRRIADSCGPRVQVQAQVAAGVEILLGMVNDPQFGPIATIGSGGVLTELLEDSVSFVPPVDARAAEALLRRLKGFRLLEGYRGSRPADVASLARAVERFSVLCAAIGPQLAEIDVNPVLAGPDGAVAVDALMVPLSRP
ncbi:MAG: acetate--CoA ligase family protein [Alphaproteobacteria bacterium]|nr:acetate--CoA ligase family protein [Alphaproteobacteria bacterium]